MSTELRKKAKKKKKEVQENTFFSFRKNLRKCKKN